LAESYANGANSPAATAASYGPSADMFAGNQSYNTAQPSYAPQANPQPGYGMPQNLTPMNPTGSMAPQYSGYPPQQNNGYPPIQPPQYQQQGYPQKNFQQPPPNNYQPTVGSMGLNPADITYGKPVSGPPHAANNQNYYQNQSPPAASPMDAYRPAVTNPSTGYTYNSPPGYGMPPQSYGQGAPMQQPPMQQPPMQQPQPIQQNYSAPPPGISQDFHNKVSVDRNLMNSSTFLTRTLLRHADLLKWDFPMMSA
jgi:hypothetical protein